MASRLVFIFSRLLPFSGKKEGRRKVLKIVTVCACSCTLHDENLFCYCRWGRNEKVLPDGSVLYEGGITRQLTVKTGIKYNNFVKAAFDRLGIIDPSDKILHFTAKFNKSRLIDLTGQEDINALLQFNVGSADVYASSLEKEPYSRPTSGGMKKVEHIIVSDTEPDTTQAGDDDNDNKCGVLSKAAVAKIPTQFRVQTAPVFVDIRTKQKDEKHEKLMGGMREGAAMPNLDCKSRKRSRKQTVELGERDDTSISVEKEDVEIENGNNPPAGQGTGVDGYGDRRQYVSYIKGVSDEKNDLASPLKKAWAHQSAGDSKPRKKNAVGGDDQKHAGVTRSCSNSVERFNQNGVGLPEGDVQNNNSKVGTVNEQASRPPSGSEKKVELTIDSDSEPDTIPDNNLPVFYSPYPELSDFDNHKAENCFAVDQIWAVYDMLDGMPRLYAHIRKVFSPEKMKLRWLVPHPEDQMESAWVRVDLPVGCGKFRSGGIGYTSDLLTFSHQVQCEKGERGAYIIYPRKGKAWALFKDWDIHWSSSQKNHREYKYEVVEILSDYVKNVGVKVGYLDKLTGFVCLFQQTRLTVVGSFFIKPKELYKFSHQILSFKMTGTEGEGVPVRSFELDPASLPVEPDDIWYPGKFKEDRSTGKSEPVENVVWSSPWN
ncbi:hypothetical protein K7X08_036277 [Anisodus acutangulus]|uniref:DUF3444 domain-containing protein n=1 Tax=Anisodus acutangulus TaxID=402998 RepID=A0A9Q1L5Q4_9SOLA|nr:hypothetical protein K7X08_036277 [Anisodus acutangulus]